MAILLVYSTVPFVGDETFRLRVSVNSRGDTLKTLVIFGYALDKMREFSNSPMTAFTCICKCALNRSLSSEYFTAEPIAQSEAHGKDVAAFSWSMLFEG